MNRGRFPGPLFFSSDERAAAAALLLFPTAAPPSFDSPPSAATNEDAQHRRGGGGVVGSLEEGREEEPSASSSSLAASFPSASSLDSCVSDSSSALAAFASSAEVRADPLRLLSLAACCREVKRKVVRKARSKVLYGSISRKNMGGDWPARLQQEQMGKRLQDEDTVASCLSGTSTAAAAGVSTNFPNADCPRSPSPPWSPPGGGRGNACVSQPPAPPSPVSATSGGASCSSGGSGGRIVMRMRRVEGNYVVVGRTPDGGAVACRSNGVRRRAEAILEFLCSRGCTSEVRIRAALGDSPDTSKALRMLVKLEQVKRSGTGGRQDPFLYWVSGGGRTLRPSPQLGSSDGSVLP